MIERDSPVTQEELHAFVDGEIPADRRGALEAWLQGHPDDAARVADWRDQADAILRRLFKAYLADVSLMPPEWAAKAAGPRARAVADYIAGMTDRFAIAEHARLFDAGSDLR